MSELKRLIEKFQREDPEAFQKFKQDCADTGGMAARRALPEQCKYCAGEPTPGYIEHPDNGPITPCPMCNPQTDRQREYGLALQQRASTRREG